MSCFPLACATAEELVEPVVERIAKTAAKEAFLYTSNVIVNELQTMIAKAILTVPVLAAEGGKAPDGVIQ